MSTPPAPSTSIPTTSTGQHESSHSTIKHGSCLCKSVQYTLRGNPITFRVCHCMNCKKSTGSAFMTNVFFFDEVCWRLRTQIRLLNRLLCRILTSCKERIYYPSTPMQQPQADTPSSATFVRNAGLTSFFDQWIRRRSKRKSGLWLLEPWMNLQIGVSFSLSSFLFS